MITKKVECKAIDNQGTIVHEVKVSFRIFGVLIYTKTMIMDRITKHLELIRLF